MRIYKEKTIRVLIEIPEKWVDFESPLGFLSSTIKQMVKRQLKEVIVEQYISKIELPAIKITKEEIKDRMLTILAQRALEEGGEE